MNRIYFCVVALSSFGSWAWSQEVTPPEGVQPAAFDSRTGEKKTADKKPEEKKVADKTPEPPAIPAVDVPIEQLGKQFRLVGKLKQPLGELVKVQGMIVNGSGKGYEDGLNIRVFRINGQATQEFLQVKVRDYYGREEIPNLTPGYMCELEGFETGGFVGVPVEAVKRGGVLAQTTGYHFLHEFKVIDSAESKLQPFSPVDFLGRDMLVQGQAVTENGSAYIAGSKWKLLIDNGTPWPRNTDGKTVEARGIVRTIGKSTTYRLENSGKANNARLVNLQDQVGKPVTLRGLLVEKNGEWSFKYRGQSLHVDGLKDLAKQTNLRNEAQLTGTLDMLRVTVDSTDSFNGERITRTEYIVRKAALKPTEPLLAIERAEPVE